MKVSVNAGGRGVEIETSSDANLTIRDLATEALTLWRSCAVPYGTEGPAFGLQAETAPRPRAVVDHAHAPRSAGMTEPGTALLQRDADGTIRVLQADEVIRVSRELLLSGSIGRVHHQGPDDRFLQLDTAGEYVYEYIGPDPSDHRWVLYRRISEETA